MYKGHQQEIKTGVEEGDHRFMILAFELELCVVPLDQEERSNTLALHVGTFQSQLETFYSCTVLGRRRCSASLRTEGSGSHAPGTIR